MQLVDMHRLISLDRRYHKMATDRVSSKTPVAVAEYNSSGFYNAPAGVNRIFVSTIGASGGPGGLTVNGADSSGQGGPAISGGAAYAISPGITYTVTIGAVGARGTSGTNITGRYGIEGTNNGGTGSTGGSTTFDSSVTANGGTGGSGSGAATATGSAGTMSFGQTSLPPVYPAGAVVRTVDTSTGATQGARAGRITIFPLT